MNVHGLRGTRIGVLAGVWLCLGCDGGAPSTPISPQPQPPPPPITVSGISPNIGSTAGSSVVTISGTGFQSGATATIGGTAIRVSQVTALSIVGTAAAHAAGTVDVVVMNPGGQSGTLAGGFTYAVLPYAITSSAGTIGPGNLLSVTWTAPTGG